MFFSFASKSDYSENEIIAVWEVETAIASIMIEEFSNINQLTNNELKFFLFGQLMKLIPAKSCPNKPWIEKLIDRELIPISSYIQTLSSQGASDIADTIKPDKSKIINAINRYPSFLNFLIADNSHSNADF